MQEPVRSWQGLSGSPVEEMNHGTPPTPALTLMLSPMIGADGEKTRRSAGVTS